MAFNNPILQHFWFQTDPRTGFSVNAYSLADAKEQLKSESPDSTPKEIKSMAEEVDIQTQELNSVLPAAVKG